MIDDIPPLRDVISKYGLDAKKSLGQNFLLDFNIIQKIALTSGPLDGITVIEIGPGPGGLTRALLAGGAKRVIAIERDERCLPALAEIGDCYPDMLEVVHGDALEIDCAQYCDGPTRIIANLPYNVATPLLTGWLTGENWPPFYSAMSLMFQKEVAERIVAKPGDKAYGRLAVLAGWRTDAQIAFNLDPQNFTPAPKVMSSVVTFTPKSSPLPARVKSLETITKAAFGQRRKMLRQSLKSLGGATLLERAGIAGTRRAEELDIEEFVNLANEWDAMAKSKSGPRFLSNIYGGKKPSDTKELYRDWANSYDQEVEGENDYAQPRRCAEALSTVLDDRAGHILDIGCGTGLSGLALREAGFAAIDGCDFSNEMLEVASAKSVYQRLFFADLNQPPIDASNEQYDGATAVGVFAFDHISPDALDEILRILKPGAPLVIGLNEKFYDKGTLEEKFNQLELAGIVRILSREIGDHLPVAGIKGWTITLRKSA